MVLAWNRALTFKQKKEGKHFRPNHLGFNVDGFDFNDHCWNTWTTSEK